MATSSSGTTNPATISIPVSAAWHLVVGIVLALIAIVAFWVHFQLATHSAYRATAIGVGLLAACTALTYWLWCAIQCLRAETAEHREATDAITEDVDELRGDLDRIEEAVKELTGAVNALQDCYLKEGQAD